MEVLALLISGLKAGFYMFYETFWPLVLGFALSGITQSFISRAHMQKALGDARFNSLFKASIFGMISSSCSYAATAMSKSLFQKGANFTASIVFMVASTNLVLELGLVMWVLLGWQFTLAQYLGGIIMISLLALFARFFFTTESVSQALTHLNSKAEVYNHEVSQNGEVVLKVKLKTLSYWIDAASYTVADFMMLRKELLIGYVVAGFLTVLVPNSVWRIVFFSGHGFYTTLENVIVGPFIALLSFVCSIGNVPLALALWNGGISFGGVISFIFADLITLPLLLIYRVYYGWNMTLRLLGILWFAMSVAALIVEVIFKYFNLIPKPHLAKFTSMVYAWDYTAFLNIAALFVLVGLYGLYRQRSKRGSVNKYYLDPVCGMQVEIALAPAQIKHKGENIYFCSDHCRGQFLKTNLVS